jgi:integrase
MQEITEKWPKVVKRGGAEVKIYRISNRGRVAYQVAWWTAGKRCLKNFARFTAAKTHADEQASLLSAGHLGVARMLDTDREAFVAASAILRPLGVPLLDAVKGYVAATQALRGNGSLLDAAKEYAARHPTVVKSKPLPDVADEFLRDKEQDGASPVYLRALRYHLNPLRERFKTPIANISTADLNDWLRSLGHSPRTRKNAATTIGTLFAYARDNGHLPKNVPTEAEGITRPKKTKAGAIGILSPDELQTILAAAETDEQRAYFSIAAFTGIRAAEMARLKWENVNLAGGHVEISADNAKTAARRLVPIGPALAAWLESLAHKTGLLFTSHRAAERLVLWAGKIIGRWPQNALRHSFISYRVAQSQDVAKTALEAGNSPAIIFSNYRELLTAADAARWFSIMPAEQPANVVRMKGKAA